MKKHIRFTLIPLILIGLAAGNAHAGDDEALAAIGGFFAGVITSAIIDDHNDRDRVHVSVHGGCRDRDRYYDRHRRDCRKHDHRGYKSKHHRSGHWETRRVRVWVPGYWDVEYTRCGDRVKVWRRGHYEWRKERVWVAYRDRGRHRDRCG